MRSRLRQWPLQLVVGAGLVGVFVGVGVISLVWTPYDVETLDVAARLAPPGTDGHLLGTDRLGRDLLTQLMVGARNSLLVAVVSTTAALIPGVLVGLLAAASGRLVRETLSRATDVAIALPGILIALVLATAIGPGNTTTMIAITAWFVPVMARVTIGPARQILAREFVEAARAGGRGRWFILLRHVLPNIAPVIIVQTSLLFASAILIEAALSYLGVGAQRPTTSWGMVFNEAQAVVGEAPSLVLIPGVVMVVTVLGFNLLGDGLRAVLDPRQTTKVVA
ncbi:ABC transporter permease [Jiangella gansuensis]|uniref:ABC transporter permease n=1 Tax=Jiangella gansuensis TaxID=281473 RepID=UPI0004BBB70C|nr:ABC transporter permease [Jiangella gansuensis]